MGEIYISKNQYATLASRSSTRKSAFKLTTLVIAPLIFVLFINLFDVENIILAKSTSFDEAKNKESVDTSFSTVSFDASDFIASEDKYLTLLSQSNLQDLEKKNFKEAKDRMRFDYSQTGNLSSEERQYLENLIWKNAGYLAYILGEPRYSKNIPVEIHFYSQNYLPKADSCTKLGGNWKERDSVCLSYKDATLIKIADNWNGSHINKFTYTADENGDRVINSFEGYRINLAIGENNRKLKKLMGSAGIDDASENDSCDANGLQKTIAHELAHNYNSIINPSQYDEAIAYYSSVTIQRIMADNAILKKLVKNGILVQNANGQWAVSDAQKNNAITFRDAQLAESLAKFNCINSQLENSNNNSQNIVLATSSEKQVTLSDYQLAEKLLGENEKMDSWDLASCIMESYKMQVPTNKVFIQSFDFPSVIASCVQGVGDDTIKLSRNQ